MRKALIILATIWLPACDKQEKASVSPTPVVNATPVPAPRPSPEPNLGPAGQTVQLFFRNLEFEHYQDMWAQTVHSRQEKIFIKHLEDTPIRCLNAKVLAERPLVNDNDWEVDVAADLTSVTCAFATSFINLKLAKPGETGFKLKPSLLGIEQTERFKQTWRVVHLGEKYLIDLGAGNSKIKRSSNFMNYILDTADLGGFPMLKGENQEDLDSIQIAVWLATLSLDLDLSEGQIRIIMSDAKPLIEKGLINLKELMKKRESTKPRFNS